MSISVASLPGTLLAQTTTNPPGVSYNVAFIAAVASVVAAVITGVVAIVNAVQTRRGQKKLQDQQAILALHNQTALQEQQARLTKENQTELAHLAAQLKSNADLELERTKSKLTEESQTRLEAVKADFAAQNQKEVEYLRSALADQTKDRDARRDYEYDAHKRLYEQCEPLLFQLADLAEHAYHRIYSIARSARRGDLPYWFEYEDYYKRSTMYKLIVPLVIFRLIQQRLTFIDLTLDSHIAHQYRLLKFLYLTFTDPFEFAKLSPSIDHDPDNDDWENLRKTDPQKYWRQGMYLGVLDNSIDALIIPGEPVRWKTYGEFEAEIKNKSSATHKQFLTFSDILHGFHPQGRPIFWRMLVAQSMIYRKIVESQAASGTAVARVGLSAISPRLPNDGLDWRKVDDTTRADEAVLMPERVALEYLQTRLPEVFGKQSAAAT
jgi:hypothetical protein